MAKITQIRETKSIIRLKIQGFSTLPNEVQEIMLGFSIGDSIKDDVMELELPNDTKSDEETNKEILAILLENSD